ncbi:MAG: hypothetical protein CBB97_07925 [Candidatus Endolissoclinum sp. TMED37]|nr:MAG: hypothetical protein CBB97_07925 [Candidatus Endolissoclinum sp. TMED37]|tara:strand:- start:669 stop:1442 length:774 start_codon:yes stop_codon:yes gene_type:complete
MKVNGKYIINIPIAKVFKYPDKRSNLETEFLFGESIKIIDQKSNWVFCENLIDQYQGWIEKDVLGNYLETTHYVNKLNSIVFSKPHIKSFPLFNLTYNSKVLVNYSEKNWSEICLDNGKNKGYVPEKHLSRDFNLPEATISNSKYFLNVPYLWGGKSYQGIDCSGFIQLIHQTSGKYLPRDSNDQMQYCKKYKQLDNIKKGALIFWNGHVALAIDKENIIHANAFHMNVAIENFLEAKNRISKNYGNILNICQEYEI